MSDYTQRQVEDAVCKHFRQKPERAVEGPFRFGDHDVWRVWTFDPPEDEYHAHYAVAEGKKPLQFFEDFSPFAAWVHRTFDLDGKAGRDLQALPVLVASLVVIAAMGLVIYVVVTRPSVAFPVEAVLTAIAGGAAGFLFGRLQRAGSRQIPPAGSH